jgi:hypothetical protein
MRPSAVLLVSVILSGCYSFREIGAAQVTPGERVRVTVSAVEAARQEPVLGRLTQTLEGQVVANESADALGLTVAGRAAAASGGPAFNAFVTVPLDAVQRIEVRSFSAGRTALLAGAGAAVVVAALAIDGGGTGDGPEDPGNNSRVRLPLIRIPFR